MTKILCNYNDATVKCLDMFTSGMVGAEISFEFSEEWEGLTKTAVFSAGDVQRDVLIVDSNVITIPWEVLQCAKEQLIVGVYGTNGTELVIPTVYAGLGRIKTGADPSGDPGIPPTPSILDQAIQAAAESIAGAQSAAASEAAAAQILEEVKDVQTGVQAQIDAINDLIPEDADPENKLATESLVNDAAGEIIDKLGAVPVVVSSSIDADETAATLVETTVNLNTGADAEHLVPMPIANTEQVGMMTPEQVAALQNALTAISALQGQTVRLLYVAGNTPTAAEIQAFVISHGYDDPTKWPGFAVVVAGTYHIWHYYNDDGWRDDGLDTVSVATSAILGVVKGSNTDGKIFVESDGTMTMNGYDAIITALANLAANKADDDAVYHEFKLNYNGTNITKDGQPISFADVLTACNDRTKFVYLVADNRLFIPQYTDAGIVSFSCAYVNDDDLNIRRIRYLANGNITSAVVSTYTKAQIDAMISELKETLTFVNEGLTAEVSRAQTAEAKLEETDKAQNVRLENIEAAADGTLYQTIVNSSESYAKSAPNNSLPFAKLDSIGGKTVVVDGDLVTATTQAVVSGEYRLDTSSLAEKYFPDGMHSAGEAFDNLDIQNAQAEKRIFEIDLGDLTWQRVTSPVVFFRANTSAFINANAISARYACVGLKTDAQMSDVGDMSLAINANLTGIKVRDNASESLTGQEFKSAVTGVKVFYEAAEPLITPITEDIDPYITTEAGGTVTFENDQSLHIAVPSVVYFYAKKDIGGGGGGGKTFSYSRTVEFNDVSAGKYSIPFSSELQAGDSFIAIIEVTGASGLSYRLLAATDRGGDHYLSGAYSAQKSYAEYVCLPEYYYRSLASINPNTISSPTVSAQKVPYSVTKNCNGFAVVVSAGTATKVTVYITATVDIGGTA